MRVVCRCATSTTARRHGAAAVAEACSGNCTKACWSPMRSTACSRPTRPLPDHRLQPRGTARRVPRAAARRHLAGRRAGPSEAMRQSLADDGMWRGEMVHSARRCVPHAGATVSAVRGRDGAVRNHVVAVSDITQSRQQSEQLQRQAHFDELTGLPNRVQAGTACCTRRWRRAEREGSLLTVCYLDLDHFKPINDAARPRCRRRAAVQAGRTLSQASLRACGRWRRRGRALGGDEFVLLLRTATLRESRMPSSACCSDRGCPALSGGRRPGAR